jgi:hypothetical protein
MPEQEIVHTLYKKLLALYPQTFKEQLGESMERTFQDLWKEKRQTKKDLFAFILWTFIETAVGIFREHLLLISPGDIMQSIVKPLGSSVLVSFLLVLPLAIMEVVNRRHLNEDFPFMLFFVLWLNWFAISSILLPIVRGGRRSYLNMADPVHAQGSAVLTNPKSSAMISVALVLAPGILPLLDSIGWFSLDRLFNGPNPDVAYLPGQVIALSLILFPIAAGAIAGGTIVRTLRAGGSLFAHPIHLIIVVIISFFFATSVVSLIVDQWPCFIGVPICD